MTQAVCSIATHSKQTLTRRAALTGAVAVVVPSVALAQGQCSFPDLAAELALVRARWVRWTNQEQARNKTRDAYATAKTGLTEDEARLDQCCHPARPEDGPKWKAYWDAWQEFNDIEPDPDPLNDDGGSIELYAIHDAIYPVCNKIMRQTPRSMTDLAIQVQAFALINRCEYLEPDFTEEFISSRGLADAVCAFCGVEPLPGFKVEPLSDQAEG